MLKQQCVAFKLNYILVNVNLMFSYIKKLCHGVFETEKHRMSFSKLQLLCIFTLWQNVHIFIYFFYLNLKNTDFIVMICIKWIFTGFLQASKRNYCDNFKICFSNSNAYLYLMCSMGSCIHNCRNKAEL